MRWTAHRAMDHFARTILFVLSVLGPGHLFAQADTWQPIAPMPIARVYAAMAETGGRLYLTPGYLTNSFVAYDPAANSWTTLPALSVRAFVAAAAVGGKIYVIGGCNQSDCAQAVNLVQAYDVTSAAWVTKSPLPAPRFGAAIGVIGGKIYVAAGSAGCPPCIPQSTTLDVYDPATNAWTSRAPIPTSRESAASAVLNEKLYVIGGLRRTASGVAATNVVEAYDPAANTWTTVAPLPASLMTSAAVAIGAHIHVVGGNDGTGALSSSHFVFDPISNIWTSGTAMPATRFGHAAAAIGPKLYVTGGAISGSGEPVATGHSYTLSNPSYALSIAIGGSGTVTSSPVGVNCPTTCAATFVSGTSVTLTANAGVGQVFLNWSGACSGSASCTVLINAAASVTATFGASGALVPNPASVDFAGQSVQTTSPTKVVVFTNSGSNFVTVSSIAASTAFAVTHNCTAIPAGSTCAANLTFTPTTPQPVTGTLTVNGSAGVVTVPLSGSGELSLASHYYRSILRREPDDGGRTYWSNQAARVTGLGADMRETWYAMTMAFFFSPEYRSFNRNNTEFARDLYTTFFNRAPDDGGLAYWTTQLNTGMPREVLLASFMFSTEFKNFTQAIFGDTSTWAEVDTIVDFYRGFLARLPDSGGFNFWVNEFRTAQCQGAAAVITKVHAISHSFLNSTEYLARNRTDTQYVSDLYDAFMRRGGDLAGVSDWVQELTSGRRSRERLRQDFIASAEFSARVSRIIAERCDANQGLMEGAVYYTGDYLATTLTTYTTASGSLVQVSAVPGQVAVHFNTSVSRPVMESSIEEAGGIIIGKLPRIGYFLAQVAPGAEDSFIRAIRGVTGVSSAMPNGEVDSSQPVPIDESWLRNRPPRAVPLNVRPGVIVIDTRGGNHGTVVSGEVVNAGSPVGGLIRAEDGTGKIGHDSVTFGLTAAVAGRQIFTPSDPIIVNMSLSSGGNKCNWVGGCGDPAGFDAVRHRDFQEFLGGILEGVSKFPQNIREKLMVINALGNGNAVVTPELQKLREKYSAILDENFILAQADQAITPTPLRPNGRYSNTANDPAVINYDGSVRDASGQVTHIGTSFAAPKLAAAIEQTMKTVGGLKSSQAKRAVMDAINNNLSRTFVLSEAQGRARAILVAQCNSSVSPPSDSIHSPGGSRSFTVYADSQCAWEAATSANWVTLTARSGRGIGTVVYAVAANPDATHRTGTIVVAGQVYTVTQSGHTVSNLMLYPADIAVSKVPGTSTNDSPLLSTDTLYIDFTVINPGTMTLAPVSFNTELFVDGVLRRIWLTNPPLSANSVLLSVSDYSIGSLAVGPHSITVAIDRANLVEELNESDNEYTKTITIVDSAPTSGACSYSLCHCSADPTTPSSCVAPLQDFVAVCPAPMVGLNQICQTPGSAQKGCPIGTRCIVNPQGTGTCRTAC